MKTRITEYTIGNKKMYRAERKVFLFFWSRFFGKVFGYSKSYACSHKGDVERFIKKVK